MRRNEFDELDLLGHLNEFSYALSREGKNNTRQRSLFVHSSDYGNSLFTNILRPLTFPISFHHFDETFVLNPSVVVKVADHVVLD